MKRFTVLGYSANDEVWCLSCLRAAAGLGPGDPDYDGRPILPLYAGDNTVLEEVCNYCHSPLLDLAMMAEGARAKARPPMSGTFEHDGKGRPTIRFPAAPSPAARAALKAAHWRWDPSAAAWFHTEKTANPPADVPVPAPRPVVTARPPIIRKRAALAAS